MHALSYSQQLAEWALSLSQQDLPDDVVETTKLRLLDTIGLMVAATESPLGRSARAGALSMSSGSDSRIIGFGDRASAMTAAFVDGTLAHAEDFDDTHDASLVHPSAAVVATALSVGEKVQTSGSGLLLALAAGIEVNCRLGAVAPMAFHKRGLHPTGLLTGFGAAVAAGRLLGLDAAGLTAALGIHGSQASGLLESLTDGSWVKTMHPGWAALGGISAVHLAAHGFTGPSSVLEGRFGVFSAFAGGVEGVAQLNRLTRKLGQDWELRKSSIKLYPCAHVIHPFLDLVLALRTEGLSADDVVEIKLLIAENYLPVVAEPRAAKLRPATPTHARASLPYCVAAALHLGDCGPDAFTESAIREPAILALAERISAASDPMPSAAGEWCGRLIVSTHDGRRLERHQENHRGSNENPLVHAEVEDKFERNTARVLTEGQRRLLRGRLEDLSALDSTSLLIDCCVS